MSDIFVVLPPLTDNGGVIFAKNADRPPSEVQEVIFIAAADNDNGQKLKCTFVEIDQAPHTNAVILSKPAWAWGAEMGANEHGLCIGCTSVWTKLCHPGDHEEKLIGPDFVRKRYNFITEVTKAKYVSPIGINERKDPKSLGLERSVTAEEAVHVITNLLETHGQGGLCSEDHNFGQWTYNNAFVMADRQSAWLLETAGQQWAAKKIPSGLFNTSSLLTIGPGADLTSANLGSHAQSNGFWKSEDGELDFAKAYSADYSGLSLSEAQRPENRLKRGRMLLENCTKEGKVTAEHLFQVLRDEDSSINFIGELLTVGSHVSVLSPPGSIIPSCHWFTSTPNPAVSVFKPFMFSKNVNLGTWTMSSAFGERPRAGFQTSVDRRHPLYKAHERARELMESGSPVGQKLQHMMQGLENQCVTEVSEFLKCFQESDIKEVHGLFKDIAESESKFY